MSVSSIGIMDSCCCTPTASFPQLIVYPEEPRYGAHVGLQSTLYETVSAPKLKCMQMYLGSSRSYQCRQISDIDKAAVQAYCKCENCTLYVHAPLVTFANLSRPDIVEKSQEILVRECKVMEGLPCACVSHIGKVGSIPKVVNAINEILPSLARNTETRVKCPLLLENAAGQGTELGHTWDELRHIFEGIDDNRVGLCLDTQHLFAAGMCDFSSHESVVKLFDQAEAVCSTGISLIHLNDSERPFNSRVDRHASLGEGYIWSQSDAGLKALLRRCFQSSVDVILETPNSSQDLKRIKSKYI